MTMHEINAAAEAITAAADPEANIIFGATINPDIDGEIIITVVATGFDEAYNHRQKNAITSANQDDEEIDPDAAKLAADVDSETFTKNTDLKSEDIEDINMDLKESKPDMASDLHEDTPLPNMWTLNEDKEKIDDSEFDKPSFLRRLKRRKKDDKTEEKDKL